MNLPHINHETSTPKIREYNDDHLHEYETEDGDIAETDWYDNVVGEHKHAYYSDYNEEDGTVVTHYTSLAQGDNHTHYTES